MKNILARGGIEFIAVLLGISGSLWVDDYRLELANQEKTIHTLESLKNELEKIKDYEEYRAQKIENDSHALHFILENWGRNNPDSLINMETGNRDLILSLKAYFAVHPPMAIYNSLNNDGSIGLIDNLELKEKINVVFQIRPDHISEAVGNQKDLYRRFNEYIIKNHPLLINTDLKNKHKELVDFLSDPIIFGFLSEQKGMRGFIVFIIENHIEYIKDLIDSIDTNLEKT
ncbi:MAG: hypothetical protein ISR82_08440 [Candidatus Marinimicrobia bacterium]|nr:hypothetical protein [Candidatus Neomarinimicrobiota bacterium]MBL7011235.1 hypothetical protein [Candidatus Neomarinimicrobiota bacterium]MBL7030709.1 hypothetical protein [Candidatus Neomarinimicrobiota bacterium]